MFIVNNAISIKNVYYIVADETLRDILLEKKRKLDMRISPSVAKKTLQTFENGMHLEFRKEKIVSHQCSPDEEFHILMLISAGYVSSMNQTYYMTKKGQILLAFLSNEKIIDAETRKLEDAGFSEMMEPLLFEVLEQKASCFGTEDKKSSFEATLSLQKREGLPMEGFEAISPVDALKRLTQSKEEASSAPGESGVDEGAIDLEEEAHSPQEQEKGKKKKKGPSAEVLESSEEE